MALFNQAYKRALYEHNHDEDSYERQERIRSYAIGTDHQLRSDAETIRENLYASFSPKGRDAFSMPDPFMDEAFEIPPAGLNDTAETTNFKPFRAPEFPKNRVIDFASDAYYTLPYNKLNICLDNIILHHKTWTDPRGHVLHICQAVMGINGYVIWETYSWEL